MQNKIVSKKVAVDYEVVLPNVTMHKIPVTKVGTEIVVHLGFEPSMDIGYQITNGLTELGIIDRDTTKISVNKKAPVVKIERKKVLSKQEVEEPKSSEDFFKGIQEQLSGNKKVISSKPEGFESLATEVRSEEEFKKLLYILSNLGINPFADH